jgi:hypothetical protein
MSRLWLAALGAAAVIACGDDDAGGGPNDQFPDVAGVYDIEGEFDGVDPSERRFSGTVTIEQESLESSLLTGTATITITSAGGPDVTVSGELLDAGVSLAGEVGFRIEQGAITWEFIGQRGGDVLEGTHTLTQGAESADGTWSGER